MGRLGAAIGGLFGGGQDAAARDAQMGGVRQRVQAQQPQMMAMQQPNAWTPSPFAQQTPYVQAMGQQGRQQAGATEYGAQLGLLGQLSQQPWTQANVAQSVVPQSQASMYGAYAGGLADILGAYYPAAGQTQTAHFPAAAQMYGADQGANLQRDLMQMGNEAKGANLQAMLQALGPMMQPRPPAAGFQTSYGAGVS